MADIRAQTEQGVIDETAVLLKQNWPLLRDVINSAKKEINIPESPSPSDDDFRRYAASLIKNGKLTFGEKNISLEEVDTFLSSTKDPKFLPLKSLLGNRGLRNLVPNDEDITGLAHCIEEPVNNNQSGFSKIWNYIAGFFQWLFSGCKGSMSEAIANQFSYKICTQAEANIREFAKDNPRLQALNAPGGVDAILDGVQREVRVQAGVEQASQQKNRLEDVKIGSMDANARQLALREIYNQAYKESKESLHSKIEGTITFLDRALGHTFDGMPGVEQRKKEYEEISKTIADSLTATLNSPAAKDKNADELATLASENVKKALGEKAKDGKMWVLKQKSSENDTPIVDMIAESVAKKTKENYNLFKMVTNPPSASVTTLGVRQQKLFESTRASPEEHQAPGASPNKVVTNQPFSRKPQGFGVGGHP